MKVKVRVYATLRRYLSEVPLGGSAMVELPGAATLGDALDRLGIPRAETKVCFVNGRQRELDHCLCEDDEVGLFPPIAGGDGYDSSSATIVIAARGHSCTQMPQPLQ